MTQDSTLTNAFFALADPTMSGGLALATAEAGALAPARALASGLRLSELCQLRGCDIDSAPDRMCIRVIQGKGVMPPRAGTSLSDDQIRAAVDFMVATVR